MVIDSKRRVHELFTEYQYHRNGDPKYQKLTDVINGRPLTAMVEHALDDFVWIPAVADDELIIEGVLVFFLILLELEPFITETNSLI